MRSRGNHSPQFVGLILTLASLMSAAILLLGPARLVSALTVAPSWNFTGNLNTNDGHPAVRQSSFGFVSSSSTHENPLSLNRWSSNGPEGGIVLSLAIDRSNTATIYAGTPTGVFKSTNGGESWSSSLINVYVQIVASAPTTPNTLYAAGRSGVHKSTDGGTSWNELNNGLEDQDGPVNVLALAIDPTNSNTIYAAGRDISDPSTSYKAIYKSADGGESWIITKHSIRSYAIHRTLAIDPINTSTIYAAGSVGGGTVWKSTDNGRFWSIVNVGLDSRSTVYALAIDPNNTNVIYVGTETLGVYKSNDGGGSWSAFSDGLSYHYIDDSGQRHFSRVSSIIIDPLNSNIVYAGTNSGVFNSSNGGRWSALNSGLSDLGVNALALDPVNPSIGFTGTDGGVFKSSSGGASWSLNNNGLPGVNVNSLALNRGNADVYAGTDSGTFRSNDHGGNWSGRDFYPLAFDPHNSNTIYAQYDGSEGISKSTDGGVTWGSANNGLENNYVSVLAIDPGNSEIIYAGSDGPLFKSTNGGGNWSPIGSLSYPLVLVVHPNNSTIIYALAYDYDDSLTVFKSTDAGVSWNRSDGNSGTPFYSVSALVLDPINPATIYVSAYRYDSTTAMVFKSTDGGGSWNISGTGLPSSSVSSLVIDPLYPNNVYAGTYAVGVFKSTDGGASWNPFNDGLTSLAINALAIDASGNFLHAGTPAGVFDYQFNVVCAYSTSSAAESFPSGGAAGSVTVTTTASDCNWQASSSVSWITINSASSGSGDGTINFSVSANTGPFPRTATLNIAGQTFTANQFGAPPINQIDGTQFFVSQHYLDFLNRQPDSTGLDFWTNNITFCGFDARCFEAKRIDTSAAFFLSIEFQQTGYLVYRIYKASYGNMPDAPVPIKLNEFLPDTLQIGQGVIVNQSGWEQVLENNKQTFASEFVLRSRFTSAYATSMTPAQYVDALFAKAGVTPSAAERTEAINEFGSSPTTADVAARARALRRVAENSALAQQELNHAFVLMQYFGYLRRNPNDSPEPSLNFDGYDFWLNKLNQFNGNFINAEMVKAFLTSTEYRQRFGQP